jgi:hypothetical protein
LNTHSLVGESGPTMAYQAFFLKNTSRSRQIWIQIGVGKVLARRGCLHDPEGHISIILLFVVLFTKFPSYQSCLGHSRSFLMFAQLYFVSFVNI